MQLAIAFIIGNGRFSKLKKITCAWICRSCWTWPTKTPDYLEGNQPWEQVAQTAYVVLVFRGFQNVKGLINLDPTLSGAWDLLTFAVPSSFSTGNAISRSEIHFCRGEFHTGSSPKPQHSSFLLEEFQNLQYYVSCVKLSRIFLPNIFSSLPLTAWQTVFNSGPLEEGSWMYAEVCGGWGTTGRRCLTLNWEQQEGKPVPAGSPQAFLGAFTNRQQTWWLLLPSLLSILFRFFVKSFLGRALHPSPYPGYLLTTMFTLSFPWSVIFVPQYFLQVIFLHLSST